MGIDHFLAFMLVLGRVGTILAFLPLLGGQRTPMAIRVGFAFVFSIALYPLVGGPLHTVNWHPLRLALMLGAELLYGGLCGFVASTIFQGLRLGCELISRQMGMAMAVAADPVHGVEATVIGNFGDILAVLMFLVVGGHRMFVLAIRESFDVWPLGAFLAPEAVRQLSVSCVVETFRIALMLAAPIMVMTFVVSLMLAIGARLVQEMNVQIMAFPVRIGLGLLALTLFVPTLVAAMPGVVHTMIEFMRAVPAGA